VRVGYGDSLLEDVADDAPRTSFARVHDLRGLATGRRGGLLIVLIGDSTELGKEIMCFQYFKSMAVPYILYPDFVGCCTSFVNRDAPNG
jgi:hypothetical protein